MSQAIANQSNKNLKQGNQQQHPQHATNNLQSSYNNNPMKKKIITEKEVIEFLIYLEEKFNYNKAKTDQFEKIFEFITNNLDENDKDSNNDRNTKDSYKDSNKKKGNNLYSNSEKGNNDDRSLKSDENNKSTKLKKNTSNIMDNDVNSLSSLNESNIEEALLSCQEILISSPIMLIEFNRFLPKNYKLAVINSKYTTNFLVKVHERDESLYEKVLSHLKKHKDSELAFEDLFSKLEEVLISHKDLYEELLLIMDVKRFSKHSQALMSNANKDRRGNKNSKNHHHHPHLHQLGVNGNYSITGHNHETAKNNESVIESKKEADRKYSSIYENNEDKASKLNIINENTNLPLIETSLLSNYINGNSKSNQNKTNKKSEINIIKNLSSRNKHNPCNSNSFDDLSLANVNDADKHFFGLLKDTLPPKAYTTMCKIILLYMSGIIGFNDYTILIDKAIGNYPDFTTYLIQISHYKLNKRRGHTLLNRPLCDYDFSKKKRVCSTYYEYKNPFYAITQCSGRVENNLQSLFNDTFITIPNGSEDDKNTFRKTNYEENIFKHEDQRFEIDHNLESHKLCIEELKKFMDFCEKQNEENYKNKIKDNSTSTKENKDSKDNITPLTNNNAVKEKDSISVNTKNNKTSKLNKELRESFRDSKDKDNKEKEIACLIASQSNNNGNINDVDSELYLQHLSNISIQVIKKLYGSPFKKILEFVIKTPIDTGNVVLERINQSLADLLKQKQEQEKEIKASFERSYLKSFDYKTFLARNKEKRNVNQKAFIKEITQSQLEKESGSTEIRFLEGTQVFTDLKNKLNSIMNKNNNNNNNNNDYNYPTKSNKVPLLAGYTKKTSSSSSTNVTFQGNKFCEPNAIDNNAKETSTIINSNNINKDNNNNEDAMNTEILSKIIFRENLALEYYIIKSNNSNSNNNSNDNNNNSLNPSSNKNTTFDILNCKPNVIQNKESNDNYFNTRLFRFFYPDMSLSFANEEAFNVTAYLIFYFYSFSNFSEKEEVLGQLVFIFDEILQYNNTKEILELTQKQFSVASKAKAEEELVRECFTIFDMAKTEKNLNADFRNSVSKCVPFEIINYGFKEFGCLKNYIKLNNRGSNVNNTTSNPNELMSSSKKKLLNNRRDANLGIINNNQNISHINPMSENDISEITMTSTLSSNEILNKSYKTMTFKSEYYDILNTLIINCTEKSDNSNSNNNNNNNLKTKINSNNNKSPIPFYSNENAYCIIRFINCIYERIVKLFESFNVKHKEIKIEVVNGIKKLVLKEKATSPINPANGNKLEEYKKNTHFVDFIVLFKLLTHKKVDNQNNFEDLCKDVLGDESYLLINLDKNITALLKAIQSGCNDNLFTNCIKLYQLEKKKSNEFIELIYWKKFFTLFCAQDKQNKIFRMTFNLYTRTLCCHADEYNSKYTNKEFKEEDPERDLKYSKLIDNITKYSQCQNEVHTEFSNRASFDTLNSKTNKKKSLSNSNPKSSKNIVSNISDKAKSNNKSINEAELVKRHSKVCLIKNLQAASDTSKNNNITTNSNSKAISERRLEFLIRDEKKYKIQYQDLTFNYYENLDRYIVKDSEFNTNEMKADDEIQDTNNRNDCNSELRIKKKSIFESKLYERKIGLLFNN